MAPTPMDAACAPRPPRDLHADRRTVDLPARLFLGSPGAAGSAEFADRLQALLHPSTLVAAPDAAQAVIAWGQKASAAKAQALASRYGLPIWRMEDAFLRSVHPGTTEAPLGMVIDDLGIYYDATQPSRLEELIRQPLNTRQEARAQSLIKLWRSRRVSKYNAAREFTGDLPRDFVLVLDQTCGDLSIKHGCADSESFHRMLQAALEENPGSTIVLKVHPEVAAGKKRGHFNLRSLADEARIVVIREDTHPVRLIELAGKVYTVTSQTGFEALIKGKKVRTFGMPFYAGWGLTEDDLPAPERRCKASLDELVHAALIDYARYVNPETGERCEVEQVIAHLGLQREAIERIPAKLHAVQIPLWKRGQVRRFFPYSHVKFARSPRRLPPGASLLRWGRGRAEEKPPKGVKTLRLEDGFVRSVGLGAEFSPPVSWVADPEGIYFDATSPSLLEKILQEACFDPELLARATAFGEALAASGVTKYNVGRTPWRRPPGRADLILVPGQVESDASILYGSPAIRTNLDLLRTVRAAHPGAYIVYKPHPDVVAGLRKAGKREEACAQWCDEVVEDAPMGRLLEEVDEVHTMTSLAGFEGLLRRKRIVTYGQPFYAGWGLTADQFPLTRRTRKLTLEELVAGALFVYPLYISGATGRYTSPERALHELLSGRKPVIAKNHLESLLKRMIRDSVWRSFVAR